MALGLFQLSNESDLADLFQRLANQLKARGYLDAARLPMSGGVQHLILDWDNLRRYLRGEMNSKEVSAIAPLLYAHFGRTHREAAELFALFGLNRPAKAERVAALLGDALFKELESRQMLVTTSRGVETRLLAAPFQDNICFHDTFSISDSDKLTHVFLGRCSVRLARAADELLRQRSFERALDLCTGSGVQALSIAAKVADVEGVDINPRAIALACANAKANGLERVRFYESNLFQNVSGTFDLITANTPFLLLEEHSQATSGKGGEYGIEVALRIFEGLDEYLRPGGEARLIVSTAWVNERSMLKERLAEVLRGRGYTIRLRPINTYYDENLYHLYSSLGVTHCTLYVAEVTRTAGKLAIDEDPRSLIVKAAYAASVARNRWVGRKKGQQRRNSPGAPASV